MNEDFLKHAAELYSKDEAFAVATVVRCKAPTSGKPGDRAIVTRNGQISGWIGGGCAQPIVIDEALKSLKDGKSRLIRVSPTAGAEPSDGITGFTMMCHSGGTLDIFIEPALQKPHLMIFGRSPVAQTLSKLGQALTYRVTEAGDNASPSQIRVTPQTAIVIATQGEDDEGALELALTLDAGYVAFVASTKKWEAVSEYLQTKGISRDRLKSVRVPAGLDIGAQTPEEIAVSILAEIIQARRKAPQPQMPSMPVIETRKEKDPVCGMMVSVPSKYTSDYNGNKIYFCCAHCKSSFDKSPDLFVTA
jgi:xanthine dehydrogenase accessory factor